MAGFNTIVKDFSEATCEMHIVSPAGAPVYAVLARDADGKDIIDTALGTWVASTTEFRTMVDKDGQQFEQAVLEAVPPGVGDKTVSGYVITDKDAVKPSKIVLRSVTSPDAKAFRTAPKRNCKLDPMEVFVQMEGHADPKKIIPPKDMKVFWASQIADFIDMAHENDKGVTELEQYTEEGAEQFIALMPGVAYQMKEIVYNPKNFEGSPKAG